MQPDQPAADQIGPSSTRQTSKRMRPYINDSTQMLEEIARKNWASVDTLKDLSDELKHRSTKLAEDLRSRVDARIAELSQRARGEIGNGSQPGARQGDMFPAPPDRQVGRIRPCHEAKGTPTKWTPPPSEKIKPTWKPTDPAATRFEKALRALVQDMEKKHKGALKITLEYGQRLRLTGASFAYRFSWKGEEDLFEGARVDIIIGKRTTRGRIVSVSALELVVDAESDLGPDIRNCILLIDNTAMLVALADRMAALNGGAKPFNCTLADGVLTNVIQVETSTVPVHEDILAKLNSDQRMAVRAALSLPVSYIWGPPGTGKTKSLSAIIRALYAAKQRSLVCSNTNQAVDQVLATLCADLTGDEPSRAGSVEALRDGSVVRVGLITDGSPLQAWRDWVSLEGVTARKTKDLRERRIALEQRAAAIEGRVLPYRQAIHAFDSLDRAVATETAAEQTVQTTATERSDCQRRLAKASAKSGKLRAELDSFDRAGGLRRLLLRPRDKIERELKESERALLAERAALGQAERALAGATATLDEARRAKSDAAAATAGKDREVARREVGAAEAELGPIRARIVDIERQIGDIGSTVLRQAQVVGATATKLYLAPQAFGSFPAVVIDEASMLLPPTLYNAAGAATERVIVSGDFRQLSPIVQTDEACLRNELGRDIFAIAGVQREFDARKFPLTRTTLLKTQYRMADPICQLINMDMYNGKLETAANIAQRKSCAPDPFSGPLTIVDTSTIGAVANKDFRDSWYNLMSAVVVRNIARHLNEAGFIRSTGDVGLIVPYSGQKKLLDRMLKDAGLENNITAGTVHRYQGDEKRLIVLNLVDGFGRKLPGPWLQADQPTDEGAKLHNVAISRAKEHLVIVGDIAWLDRKLPAPSFMRQWLYRMQETGCVVDARQVVAMWPIAQDLKRYGAEIGPIDAMKTGMFDERDFLAVVQRDLAHARLGIAIWSAFVTGRGVARIADLLRERIQAGVKVRCVIRPPEGNGSIGEEAWNEGVHILQSIGATIDLRASMHEKVVLIDDETTWNGSLNLLSHTGSTHEVMMRLQGRETALKMAEFLAADGSAAAKNPAGCAYQRENPDCSRCGARTKFVIAKTGRFWSCSRRSCGWTCDISRRA